MEGTMLSEYEPLREMVQLWIVLNISAQEALRRRNNRVYEYEPDPPGYAELHAIPQTEASKWRLIYHVLQVRRPLYWLVGYIVGKRSF